MAVKTLIAELRRFLRFEVRSEVGVRIDGHEEMAVTLRDVGRGGFAIIAPMPFSPGERYQFTFTLPEGAPIVVSAMAMHRYALEKNEHGVQPFVTGWRFLLERDSPDVDRLVTAVAFARPEEGLSR